jgi:hypothetical protein
VTAKCVSETLQHLDRFENANFSCEMMICWRRVQRSTKFVFLFLNCKFIEYLPHPLILQAFMALILLRISDEIDQKSRIILTNPFNVAWHSNTQTHSICSRKKAYFMLNHFVYILINSIQKTKHQGYLRRLKRKKKISHCVTEPSHSVKENMKIKQKFKGAWVVLEKFSHSIHVENVQISSHRLLLTSNIVRISSMLSKTKIIFSFESNFHSTKKYFIATNSKNILKQFFSFSFTRFSFH